MTQIDPKTGKQIEANDPRLIASEAERIAAAKDAQAAFGCRHLPPNQRPCDNCGGSMRTAAYQYGASFVCAACRPK